MSSSIDFCDCFDRPAERADVGGGVSLWLPSWDNVLRKLSIPPAGEAPLVAEANVAVGFGAGCGASSKSAVSRVVVGPLLATASVETTETDTTGSDSSRASSLPHEGHEAVPSLENDSQRPQTMPIPGSIERSAAYYSCASPVIFVTLKNAAVLVVCRRIVGRAAFLTTGP